MILTKLEKFWEFFWKDMLYLDFDETVLPSVRNVFIWTAGYVNDDGSDDENDIEILSPEQTNIEHIKYHKENNLYTMSRSELQITISHHLTAAILLLFISAAIGYFAQGSYLER